MSEEVLKNVGRTGERNINGGNSSAGNSESGRNSGTVGKESGKSKSIKRGDRDKTNNSSVGLDGQSGGVGGKNVGALQSNELSSGKTSGDNGCAGSTGGRGGRNTGGNSEGYSAGSSSTNQEKQLSQQNSNGLKNPPAPKDVKPKSTSKSKSDSKTKKNINPLDSEGLGTLLVVGFGLIASITGREHWNISEDEALRISDPASLILNKLSQKQKKKIEEMSAPILLGVGIATVVVPRLMMDLSEMKGAKEHGRATRQIEPIRAGGNIAAVEQSKNIQPAGNANNNKANNPIVSEEIAGLFVESNL